MERHDIELAAYQRRIDGQQARYDALAPEADLESDEHLESEGFKTHGLEFLIDELVSMEESQLQQLRAALATDDTNEGGRILGALWGRAKQSYREYRRTQIA